MRKSVSCFAVAWAFFLFFFTKVKDVLKLILENVWDVTFIAALALFPRKRIRAALDLSKAPRSSAEKVKAGLKTVF